MLAQGVGEGASREDVGTDLGKGRLQSEIGGLPGKGIETIDQRKSRMDEGGELAAHNHHVVKLNLLASAGVRPAVDLPLLCNGGYEQFFTPELLAYGALVGARQHSVDLL